MAGFVIFLIPRWIDPDASRGAGYPVVGWPLVSGGLYRLSRNPMYVGVLLAVFGLAAASGSVRILIYSCGLFVFFHLLVVFVEEPRLRATRGAGYEDYLRTVPRWLGWPKR